MCMRSTPCSGDRHTTRIPTKSAEDTNLGSYSVQHFTSPLHDDRRETTPRQQGNLRLTHLQCSQSTWSRNQGSVTSSHAADSVTFAERVRKSKARPWSMILRNCDRCSQTVSHCTFINRFVQTSLTPLYAHPDSQLGLFLSVVLPNMLSVSCACRDAGLRRGVVFPEAWWCRHFQESTFCALE